MSVFTLVFLGTAPIGNSFIGALADYIGTPYTISISAIHLHYCIASLRGEKEWGQGQAGIILIIMNVLKKGRGGIGADLAPMNIGGTSQGPESFRDRE